MRRMLTVFFFAVLAAVFYFTAVEFMRIQNARHEWAILLRSYEARMNIQESSRILIKAAGELRELRHLALYNLGNLKFREALQKREAPLLFAARDHYREALKYKPDFFEAKRNLEIVESFIKEAEASKELREGQEDKDGKGDKSDLSSSKDEENNVPGDKPSFRPFKPGVP